MEIKINEQQFSNLILAEAYNPAYLRQTAKGIPSMERLWAVIDEKQKRLQQEVFGELNGKLYDITVEKMRKMGTEYAQVPKNICNAGNKKLPQSVLIINMSSSLMCPSFYLGACTIGKCKCYAQREENQYSGDNGKSAKALRWKTDLMHTQMLQQYQNGNKEPMRHYFNLIETYIQLGNAYATQLYNKEEKKLEKRLGRKLTDDEKEIIWFQQSESKITDVRLNESGDFHCQLAVELWSRFADKIRRKYGINTHAYTARHLDFSDATKSMAINASNSGVNIGDMAPRYFKAVSDKFYDSLPEGNEVIDRQPKLGVLNGKFYFKCPCTQKETHCDTCGVCFANNETGKPYTIFVRYHGLRYSKGLKYLFTNKEIDSVITSMKDNGWVTDSEYDKYNSKPNKSELEKLSANILGIRSKAANSNKNKKPRR